MATKLKNLRISKVDFVDEGANPDAHIKLTKSKGEKGQSTGENGDKNGFVSRLFGFIGKKAGMNQEEIDSAVEEVLKGNSVSFNERFNEIKNRKGTDPQVTNGDYSNAFKQVEAYEFNTICVDTEDTSVHLLLQSFINRIFDAAWAAIFSIHQTADLRRLQGSATR